MTKRPGAKAPADKRAAKDRAAQARRFRAEQDRFIIGEGGKRSLAPVGKLITDT